MKISILGLGWFGEPMAYALMKDGHEVVGSTRSIEKQKALTVKSFILNAPEAPHVDLLDTDVMILNIPPSDEQLAWFKSWPWHKKTWMIFISSTSVINKAHSVLIDEEKWVQEQFSHWTILRFGGLLGGERHPGKHLSGRKNLKDGDKMVNLLSRDFAIEFTQKVIREKIQNEILRVVNIENQTRRDFYTEYCRQKNLPLPEFD